MILVKNGLFDLKNNIIEAKLKPKLLQLII